MCKKKLKRNVRNGLDVELLDAKGDTHNLTCDVLGRIFLSKGGKLSHMQGHRSTVTTNYKMVLLRIYVSFAKKIASQLVGLKDMQTVTKIDLMTRKSMFLKFTKFVSNFKSLSGLQSHIRSKHMYVCITIKIICFLSTLK